MKAGKRALLLLRRELLLADEDVEPLRDSRAGPVEDRVGDVVQDDLHAAHEGDLRDPASHLAGAEDADLRNVI